mgnify:CR=1 FL=1
MTDYSESDSSSSDEDDLHVFGWNRYKCCVCKEFNPDKRTHNLGDRYVCYWCADDMIAHYKKYIKMMDDCSINYNENLNKLTKKLIDYIGELREILSDVNYEYDSKEKKKFKASRMKEIIVAFQHLSMDEQKAELEREFEKWRGNLEQIDDVCVIGVKI